MKKIIGFSLCLGVLFFSPPKCLAQNNWFQTGQDAYILLSGIDFNKTGGALLFNHPMNIATDGTRLLLADTRNNRILIWNTIPNGNKGPDLVLGQNNFTTNKPETSMKRLNWPVGVATGGGKVVVADTYNNRILIWNTFPTSNGQAADLSISSIVNGDVKAKISWPWDVWTDGTKLVVVNRGEMKSVLIYNTFPVINNQRADLYLKGKVPNGNAEKFITPSTIGTDGETYFVVGDIDAQKNFFWNSFPTNDNQPYDFLYSNSNDPFNIAWGLVKTNDGKLVAVVYPGIAIWNSVPTSSVEPDLFIGKDPEDPFGEGYGFNSGYGSDLIQTPSGKLFISLRKGNKIVAFNSLPTSSTQSPDFAVGSPDINTNTLETNSIITDPMPVTNGSSLFVSSETDKKLYVWKSIPNESGTHPDVFSSIEGNPYDIALHDDTLVLGGSRIIAIWTDGLPFSGRPPDTTFKSKIGSTSFKWISGVALDDNYLYVSDRSPNKIYVWQALPDSNSSPLFSLKVNNPGRLCSDGKYLAVVSQDKKVLIYRVAGLSNSSQPVAEISLPTGKGNTYSPNNVLIVEGHLFISTYSKVFCWKSIQKAINGNPADAVLGKQDEYGMEHAIGVDSLFYPAGLAFSKNKLWVGETQNSGRLVGFKFLLEGPVIELNPTFGNFGKVDIGLSSKVTFTVSNSGSKNLKVGTIRISGKNASLFTIEKDNCSGKTIAPLGSRTIAVKFSPSSYGTMSATLTIPSNDQNTPNLRIPLYGASSFQPPAVITGSAEGIFSDSALLNGQVNPNGATTDYHFEYGTSTGYGSSSASKNAGSENSYVSVEVEIKNLSPTTTYHFRLVAENGAGTSYGDDGTFTTPESEGDDDGNGNGEGGKKSPCAIATACFGTPLAKEVKILCALRDKYLLSNPLGKAFVDFYNRHSPRAADFIRNKPFLKAMVRECLRPVVWIAAQLMN